jgi:hypothetical protein
LALGRDAQVFAAVNWCEECGMFQSYLVRVEVLFT